VLAGSPVWFAPSWGGELSSFAASSVRRKAPEPDSEDGKPFHHLSSAKAAQRNHRYVVVGLTAFYK
jgi:hypothetical protein